MISEDYQKEVRWYVAEATGIPRNFVLKGNQNSPAPKPEPYATVLLIEAKRKDLASDYYTKNENDDDFTLIHRYLVKPKFSIQIYRASNAIEIVNRLAVYHELICGQYYLQQHDLFVRAYSSVRDLSVIQGSAYEYRASVDLTFETVIAEKEAIRAIEAVHIDVSKTDKSGYNTLKIET